MKVLVLNMLLVYTSNIEYTVLYVLIFIVLWGFLLYGIGTGLAYMVDQGLKKSKNLIYRQYGRLYDEKNINADLLIIGNSRASTSIDPAVLNDMLPIRTYNLGLNGGSVELQHWIFDLYMDCNTKYPQVMLIDIDWISMDKNSKVINRKRDLLPWYKDKRWKPFFERYHVFSRAEKYIPLWKYRGRRWMIKDGLKEYWGISHSEFGGDIVSYKDGYICLDDRLTMSGLLFGSLLAPDISDDFSLTDQFLLQCSQKNIKVILFYPPMYRTYRESYEVSFRALSLIEAYAGAHHIPFLDYTQRPECNDSSYFRDYWHLNRKGAAWFSRILADDLNSYYL